MAGSQSRARRSTRLGRAKGRVRQLLRPPRTLRPTRAGWVFFALTLGVGFAAMNTGNNLLYMVLSLLLAFLVLSGFLSEAALRGLRVRRRLPAELQAERGARIVLEIHNEQQRVPSFAIVVEDLLGEDVDRVGPDAAVGRVFAFRVGPGETERRSYGIEPPERGSLAFAGFRVSTRFPFGLFSKAMRVAAPAEALVFPAVDPLPTLPPDGGGTGEDVDERAGGDSPEVAGLRDHAPGDTYARVHWRASLRRGQLLVRDRARETRGERTVRLQTRGVEAGTGFERAVRRAASDIAAHLHAGFRVGLTTDSEKLLPAPGHRQRVRLLAHLACVHPVDSGDSGATPAPGPGVAS